MIQVFEAYNSASQNDILLFPPPNPSFLVGEDGGVYEGVGWNIRGGHSNGYNDIALGIAFMGNFMGKGEGGERKIWDQTCLGNLGKGNIVFYGSFSGK